MTKISEFASADLTVGQINAIVKKLGGYEGALRFLRGETSVVEPERKWREQDGAIYLSVTSDGTTGPEWIARLEKKDFRVGDYAKSVLCSKDFKPTSGVTTEIVILKGMLFEDSNRVTNKIRIEAENRKLTKPNAEIACLIRENFSDKDIEAMGLYWIVAMYEPIKDSVGGPVLLRVFRNGNGSWLTRTMASLAASGVATMGSRSSFRKFRALSPLTLDFFGS
ncbi:MAG: hypothetical protein WC164_02835 [Patescibacteria group bacterium]